MIAGLSVARYCSAMVPKNSKRADLEKAIDQAKDWLLQQRSIVGRANHHDAALAHFESYLSSVNAALEPSAIRTASRALSWHHADQFDDSRPYWAEIGRLQTRIDAVGREMEWEIYKASPAYRPLRSQSE